MVQKTKIIKCEDCKVAPSVIVDKKRYQCAECYMFERNIPFEGAIYRLRKEGLYDKLKN
jgi:protein-arginine kinase activator protein McsA